MWMGFLDYLANSDRCVTVLEELPAFPYLSKSTLEPGLILICSQTWFLSTRHMFTKEFANQYDHLTNRFMHTNGFVNSALIIKKQVNMPKMKLN